MNHKKNMKRNVLLMTILVTLACRIDACNAFGVDTKDQAATDSTLTCTGFLDQGLGMGFSCHLQCYVPLPGSDVLFPTIAEFDFIGRREELSSFTTEELRAQYCPGGSTADSNSAVVSTEEPVVTEEPIVTEEPTEPPAEIMGSILGGKVSYCAEVQGQKYLNLPFNSGADPALVQSKLASSELTVQVGNVNGNCRVDAPNELLVCAFPSGTFPNFSSTAPNSIINVADEGTIIDVILFNNSCEAEQNSSSGGGSDEAVCEPTEPGTPCYCALNPYDEDYCSAD